MIAKILEMTPDDYDEMLVLWREAAEKLGLEPKCDSRDGVTSYLARNPGMCFVARNGRKLVGALMCGQVGRRAYINHLIVMEQYCQSGIDTALLNRCAAALKKKGISRRSLFISAVKDKAAELWRKLG